MNQLAQLCRPFPADLVHTNPSGGGSYVAHDVVVQRLLQIVGPYDFHVVEVIRGYVPAIAPNPSASSKRGKEGRPALDGAVVGVIAALTVTIDGATVTVHDCGDCEDPHNWPHDGARMKDAVSDAIKRCAMRVGCGLHLWAQQDFYLYDALKRDGLDGASSAAVPAPVSAAPVEDAGAAVPPAAPASLSPREKLEARAREKAS